MRVNPTKLRDDRGAVIPIVIVSLVALFGMVVLTVDVGGLMAKRRSLVNGSDSAALAAAQSYALEQARCGTSDGIAKAQADAFARDNVDADVQSTAYQPNCAAQTVRVAYQDEQSLFFAPVLGFGNSTEVAGTATAHWGPAEGGNPLPVELDPLITNMCVYQGGDPDNAYNAPGVCPEGYWFNNGDLTQSGWGLMNLSSWDVGKYDSCTNSGGASDLSNWILQTDPIPVKLKHKPTYVCTTDGGKTPNWLDALKFWAGKDKTFLFPINDPAQMVFGPPTSIQKYAIVGFAPMQVVAVYDAGKDTTAAIGGSFSCATTPFSLTTSTLDLSTTAFGTQTGNCSQVPRSSVTLKSVSPASGGKAYKAGVDYTFSQDPSTKHYVLRWLRPVPANIKLSFDYRYGGACPGHDPDPNAFCLLLKWAGPQLIGTDPGEGEGPAMAIELIR